MISPTQAGVFGSPVLRQFIKFCVIGFSSMIIDVGLWNAIMNRWGWHWIPAQTLSFAVAVTNGFFWNSLWTFKGLGQGSRRSQYAKFVGVNIIGLLLNILIMKTVLIILTGNIIHHGDHEKMHLYLAKGMAVVCVALWNFFANRRWTFAPEVETE
jgi:putative flippase GtrA